MLHDLLLGGGAREFGNDGAVAHDEDAVGDLEELGEFGADHENGGAVAGKLVHEGEDFGFGGDVDAARGFVEEEDLRIAEKPLGDDNLLLVAAAEASDGLVDGGGADTETSAEAFGDDMLSSAADEAVSRYAVEVGEGYVGADRHRKCETGSLTVFGDEADAGADGVLR